MCDEDSSYIRKNDGQGHTVTPTHSVTRTEGTHQGRSIAARGAVRVIGSYQRYISPLFGPRCKYYPTCSRYAVEAITRFGLLKGGALAGWRLLRCNPLSNGGVDDVPMRDDAATTTET
ncbi:MAG: membrane protein insertion efficiency factor YidD [Cellulomonadaceae bacterium]|nr:membrane protein insertion efficiency factor YidD [Cellulomonadaceae bacterium]